MFAASRRVPPLTSTTAIRNVHYTPILSYPRGARSSGDSWQRDPQFDVDFLPEFEDDDATSAAHLIIQQQKRMLNYLRAIERDRPHLLALRKQFIPPSDSTPLIVRSISYGGEEHPATRKRVLVAAIAKLPLNSPEAIHKLKLLAGPRWSAKPLRDSGIGPEEAEHIGEHGYIKISCEDFPEPAMNLKWGSDVLDNMLKKSNDTSDAFVDIPHDRRHVDARARKHRKGEHVCGRSGPRPTIKDFPKHWLPRHPNQPPAAAMSS